jgi:uncharacterized protein YecT (DUF1311 family)
MRCVLRLLSSALLVALVACNGSPAPPAPVQAAPSAAPSVSATAAPPVASASPAPTASSTKPGTPADATALLQRATKCIEDPSCADDGAALFREAYEAHAKDVSCFRFYYGIGVPKDVTLARACFEREVALDKCDGSSPDLDRLYLAAMRIDGVGGPAQPTTVEPLFTGCFHDVGVTGLLAEIAKRSHPDPKRVPIDFCEMIGGTTMTMGACLGLQHDRVVADRARVERQLFVTLGAEGKPLLVAASDAWSRFADKEGMVRGDVYRGGTMSSNASFGHEIELEKQRLEALAHFAEYKPNASANHGRAERDLSAAYRRACETDGERKKLCVDAKQAWSTYREAEVALYAHAFGGSTAAPDVTRDVRTTTTTRYAADLAEIMKP